MSLTYNEVVYIFCRSIDWMHLPDEVRLKKLQEEMLRIDWDRVPDDDRQINYKDYYRKEQN